MKIQRLNRKKIVIVLALSGIVALSASAVTVYAQINKNVIEAPAVVEEKVATVRATETVEKENFTQQSPPKPSPASTPEPQITSPALPTAEENKEFAKKAVIDFALSRGYTESGSRWAGGQWVCMERMLTSNNISFEDRSTLMAFVNKFYITGDLAENQEGIQRIAFDGSGTCRTISYTTQ